jgi:vancomycin resistance protein YoaR
MTSYQKHLDDAHSQDTAPSTASTQPRAKTRTRRRPKLGGGLAWFAVILSLLVLVAGLGAAAYLYSERQFIGRIYPNISIRGLNLGSYTPNQAYKALERRYSVFMREPITINYNGQVWQPSAEELGISLDFETALDKAFQIGRQGDRVENAQVVQTVWEQGVEIPLHLRIDERALQRYVMQIARQIEYAPTNADINLVSTHLMVAPESDGRQVLVDETVQDIVASLQTLSPQEVDLRTRVLEPRIRTSAYDDLKAELATLFAGPVSMTANNRSWEWSPEQIASWVRLRRDKDAEGMPIFDIVIDQEPLRKELVPIAASLRQQGALPRVNWNNGQLEIYQAGTSDHGLDGNEALARFNEALRSKQRSFEAPIIALAPSVDETNIASLGITSEVATGVSSFRASEAYRITNIRAGSRQMHGHLIPPGATFSFNNNLGAVDASNGFVEGSAIVDNRTQKEWGGGLCQVSTTVFRAAFWAGLPIDERHEHAYRIGWYEELGEPAGLDAAIFTPYNDLRFTNDTGGWLLIQTEVDLQRQRLTVRLYGKPSDRQVTMDQRVLSTTPAPKQAVYITDPTLPRSGYKKTDFARPGIKIEVYRTVVNGNGSVLSQDTFPTEFKPWPNIFVRGGR